MALGEQASSLLALDRRSKLSAGSRAKEYGSNAAGRRALSRYVESPQCDANLAR
jgi:hypothetical protein